MGPAGQCPYFDFDPDPSFNIYADPDVEKILDTPLYFTPNRFIDQWRVF